MSIVIGTPGYFPTLNGVFIEYEVTISAFSGKNVTITSTCSNPNYRCVEQISQINNSVFTGTQTKTFVVNVPNRNNLLVGTDVSFEVTATDSGSGYTVGTDQTVVVADRVRVYLHCNGVTVKYDVPTPDSTDNLIGVMNNGDEYYIPVEVANSLYLHQKNSIHWLLGRKSKMVLERVVTSRLTNFARFFSKDYSNDFEPGLPNTTSHLFYGQYMSNQNIESWDTSRVTNMNLLFMGAISFNQDINNWDTSKVTNMSGMFAEALSFTSKLNKWDTSSVIDMQSYLFSNCPTDPDISEWNLKSLLYAGIFNNMININDDLSRWNLVSLTSYKNNFEQFNCPNFGPLPYSRDSGRYNFNINISFNPPKAMVGETFTITFAFNVVPVAFDETKFTVNNIILLNSVQQSITDSRVFTVEAYSNNKGFAKLFIEENDIFDSSGNTTIPRVERIEIGCPVVFTGTGSPSNSIEANYFYDYITGELYGPKSGGVWGPPSVVISGVVPNSNSLLFGDSSPNNSVGENGSFYVILPSMAIVGPKTAGIWGSPVPLGGGSGVTIPSFTSPNGLLPNYSSGNTSQAYQSIVSGGGVITYTLGGPDANDFIITPAGTLFFASPPDYLNPTDSNADNVYAVDIFASNSAGNAQVSLLITVVSTAPTIQSVTVSSFYPGFPITGKFNVDVLMNKSGITPSLTLTPIVNDPTANKTPFTLLSGNTFRSIVTATNGNSSNLNITVPRFVFEDNNGVLNNDQAFSSASLTLPTVTLSGPNTLLPNTNSDYQVSLSAPYPYAITVPYQLQLDPGTTNVHLSSSTLSPITFAASDPISTKTITVTSGANATTSPKVGRIVFPTLPSNLSSISGAPLTITLPVPPTVPPTNPPVFTSPGQTSLSVPSGSSSNTTPVYTPTTSQGGNVFSIKPNVLPTDDGHLFEIDAGTGEITLKDPIADGGTLPPDADGDGVYRLVVVATNSIGSTEFPIQIILFLVSSLGSGSTEPGFVGGNYSIEFNYPEFTAKSSDNVIITRSNYSSSKFVQEDLLFLIRDLIVGQLDETSVYDFPADTASNRPFLFYDHSGSTTPTSETLKLYLNKNNTVSSSVSLIIDKIVKTIYSPGVKFLQYFFSTNVSNDKINRLGFKFTSKIFNGTIVLSSSPLKTEL